MSRPKRTRRDWMDDFKVVIYESEFRQMQAWTAKFPNVETGGDLFGLWLDETTAVIQLVLGPGENCRRTSASFYQDVDYLERVGNHCIKEGLCHIGEWHSHHQLGLTCPSGGDENTVWSNMPRYNKHRCVLFIATIESSRRSRKNTNNKHIVNIDGYLFQINLQDGSKMPLKHASFETISTTNPFRNMDNEPIISSGAESLNSDDELNKVRKNEEKMTNGGNQSGADVQSEPEGTDSKDRLLPSWPSTEERESEEQTCWQKLLIWLHRWCCINCLLPPILLPSTEERESEEQTCWQKLLIRLHRWCCINCLLQPSADERESNEKTCWQKLMIWLHRCCCICCCFSKCQ